MAEIKIPTDILKKTLGAHVQPDVAEKIMAEALKELKKLQEEEGGEKEPKPKKKWLIVMTGEDEKDAVGYPMQVLEEYKDSDITRHLTEVARDYNGTPKGQKKGIKTFGELFAYAGAKFYKPFEISPKSKEPVLILKIDNNIDFSEAKRRD